ncbi:WD40/YVTN/BNR-like repeat-containing protein [Rasiella sp. SM2506]|uniref:WD40/YVTN/BNR-like repeat-containing protein n=1 Tax=Rasiella sp. SM2506 TaxID=3423914 RepID=UPI003D7AAA7E
MPTYFRKFSFSLLIFSSITLLAQDFEAFQYRNVGPLRGGRVTAVTGIPDIPGTFFLGATGGGVWKSDDYGTTWYNVSDGFFDTPSIGAIEVAPKNSNIVYVGTGSDGLRSNVISGKGMYKSVNGGTSWEHIGLKDVGQIGAVEIDKKDSNIVYVAAIGDAFKNNKERGIYKTEDGGKSWKQILFVSEETGFSDLEIHPKKHNVLYAAAWKGQRKPWTIISGGTNAEGGIYKSKNGGKDWEKLNNGLPQGLIGKIDLAVSADNPKVLYAIIEAEGDDRGLYKSEDEGKSFVHVSDDIRLVNRPFYYTNVEADPNNANIVFSMANPGLKSEDGGTTWKFFDVPHGDNHDIWLNPNDSELLIQANDGGANVSHNGGKTWSTQFNQPTAELYQVEVDDQYPYWLYAGMQDNSSTIAVPSFPPSSVQNPETGWLINTGGCETGPGVPKPGDHNIVYANCKGRFSVFDKRTGTEKGYYVGASNIYGHNPKDLEYRFQRVSPVHVSPHNPDVVYHGSQFLHKTTNDGLAWETISPDLTAFEADKQVNSGAPITRDITGEEYYSTLYSIRESSLVEGLIWTGSNDGVISVTKDGGETWTNVTPSGLPKGGRVESVEPSKFNAAKAYIAVDMHLLGDTKPYLYKTSNYGQSWELLSNGTNGIPSDFTTRVLREDPEREGLLFAGTEFGIFVSFNDGSTWMKFQQNLPVTPVTDLKIFRGDLILSTMGRGFWILDNITALRQPEINSLNTSAVLFKPDTIIRYRYPTIRGVSGLQYPETSVNIDYFIPEAYRGSVQLDILDENRMNITTILSDSTLLKALAASAIKIDTVKTEVQEQEGVSEVTEVEDMQLSQIFRYTDEKLSSKPGLHRFDWDLKQRGAWDKDIKRRYKRGPIVAPGNYIAKLTVGAQTYEQPFSIVPDPKVLAENFTVENIKEQLAFQNKVLFLLSEAKQLEADLETQLKGLKETDASTDSKSLSKVETTLQALKNEEGAYPQQMLVSQISYLLNMVSGADQVPGEEAEKRYEVLTLQLAELMD